MVFSSGCAIIGNSDVKNTEELIEAIGTVTIDSKDKIDKAENAYNALSDIQKEKVENINSLFEAKKLFLGKIIYNDLNKAVELLIDSMDTYYDTWHYGIFEDEDTISLDDLSEEVGIGADELDEAIRELELDEYSMTVLNSFYKENFSLGLLILNQVFEDRGVFTEINEILTTVKSDLKALNDKYPDYQYYQAFIDYWQKANSYYNFASDVTGNFNSFKETVNDYETSLEELKSNLSFTFED